jgi:hypothetical protein
MAEKKEPVREVKYLNARIPIELKPRIDALRERQPVPPKREPFIVWLITQAIEAEEGKR